MTKTKRSKEICGTVPSQKGNDKLNLHGYLMVKERNRGSRYYWCCEKRKSKGCGGRAVTVLKNGVHYLISG
ncbi:1968_t:CDS:1, partial [Dentiscutata heterogama]